MTGVVVLGGGADELVAAHVLARAGRKVVVLDPSTAAPGMQGGWVPGEIVRALGLELKVEQPDPWIEAVLPDGGRLALWHDMAKSVEAIRKLSPADAARWPAFCERIARVTRLLERLYTEPPPDPLGDWLPLAALGWQTRRLGRQGIEDLLRFLPIPIADLLDDWFECDALKGLLAAGAIANLSHGPRSGGTTLPLLHRHAGCPLGVFRPPETNIVAALQALPGIELRRGIEIGRIDMGQADLVLSGLDPKRTLLELVDVTGLDPEFLQAVRHIRSRPAAARYRVKLEREPDFGRLVFAPSLDYLERAYDDLKHRRVSPHPWMEAKRMGGDVEVLVQPADAVDAFAPLGPVASREALPPLDHHAELTLDQFLWMRPLPELARYATPVPRLHLCGPAMPPGYGIPGAAGWNCARNLK